MVACSLPGILIFCYQTGLHSPMTQHPQLNVRVDEAFLKRLDDWRRNQSDLPNRPEAIRRLVELALGRADRTRSSRTSSTPTHRLTRRKSS